MEIARWFAQEGVAVGELGHNEKVRRAYAAGFFNTATRGGSNSQVIRAVDRLIEEVGA